MEVKFETEKPVCFREIDIELVIDIDLSANFWGVSKVFAHEDGLYADEDAVNRAIRSNCTDIITKCLNDKWEEGVSVCRNWQKRLPDLFDQELEKLGIKAETYFTSRVLTEESAKELNELRKGQFRNMEILAPISIDRVYHEPTALMNHVLGKTPKEKTETRFGDKYCRNCGAVYNENGNFCENCGEQRR